MRLTLFVSFVSGLSLLTTSVQAQNWVPVGPPGGNVRALAADPRDPERVYLGTENGLLFRSDDGGLHWRRPGPGFTARRSSLDQIAVDGRGVLTVGYWDVEGSGGGVARSADGGATFTTLKGIDGESVRALAVAPSDRRVLAAGTRTGVFLSRDAGQRWSRITPEGHPDLRNVESLAFDPTDSQVLYVGTWHLGWKTMDGGLSWGPVHTGMIDDSDVMTLTVDRRSPQTVYATACSGVYRSTEGGEQWSKLPGIPFSSRRTPAFAQGGEDPRLLLAGTTEGLYISEDGGGSWRLATPKTWVVNAVLVQRGGSILVGTEGEGVLRSSDRGRSWVASNAGFSDQFVSRLLFDPAGRRLFVAVWGRGDVYVTSGVCGPWTRLGKGLEGRQVLSLALLGETLLAGTDDGIFARGPEALAWTRLPITLDSGEDHPRVTELLALPPRRVLAATANGVLESSDKGRTWRRADLAGAGEVLALAAPVDDPGLVMAATRSGFFRSLDGGATWRRVSAALAGATPHTLTVLPSNDHALLATTTGGLIRSEDQGATWRWVSGGIPRSDLTGLVVHPDGRTIYASDYNWGGIFRSTDGGANWERMPVGDLPSDRVWALGLDPEAPDRVLASSASGLHLLMPATIAGSTAPTP